MLRNIRDETLCKIVSKLVTVILFEKAVSEQSIVFFF
jgi:hypothetical protein